MSTLSGVAIRLHGPLQSWGGPVVGDDRPTLPIPTRSGILGLVACCMGIPRKEHAQLFALAKGTRVHVRVDAPGTTVIDDQTIQDNPNASETRKTIQSKRAYLCDASFVAIVVPGAATTVEAIANAIAYPVFSPFLGRRSCVPSSELALGVVSADSPIALFNSIPVGPSEILPSAPRTQLDYYLDAPDHPERIRRLHLRDDLAGPLPRQFRERTAVHVRSGTNATSTPPIDSWMTGELS